MYKNSPSLVTKRTPKRWVVGEPFDFYRLEEQEEFARGLADLKARLLKKDRVIDELESELTREKESLRCIHEESRVFESRYEHTKQLCEKKREEKDGLATIVRSDGDSQYEHTKQLFGKVYNV